MECELCEVRGRKRFFCEVCLNERLLIHDSSLKRLSASHDSTLQKAAQLLQAPGGVQERRLLKAKRASVILNIRSIEARRSSLVQDCELKRSSLLTKRRELAIRQTRLRAARSSLNLPSNTPHSKQSNSLRPRTSAGPSASLADQIDSIQACWNEVLEDLMDVRERLVAQLFNIYSINLEPTPPRSSNLKIEERGKPSYHEPTLRYSSIKPTPSWQILGLGLPVSTEIKSYHHEEASAATLYTSHLLRLIAMYLGIKLPFQMIMGPFLSIRAPPNSIWSHKHPSAYPLHIPSSINSMVYSSGSQVSQVAFLSGLCMLALNAHYLLSTQQAQRALLPSTSSHPSPDKTSHPSPGSKPTELLPNIYSLCHTRPIGHHSHLTGKTLFRRPDDPSDSVCADLQEVIKEVMQSKADDFVDEGWSII